MQKEKGKLQDRLSGLYIYEYASELRSKNRRRISGEGNESQSRFFLEFPKTRKKKRECV